MPLTNLVIYTATRGTTLYQMSSMLWSALGNSLYAIRLPSYYLHKTNINSIK
jgi:hypothetical protein